MTHEIDNIASEYESDEESIYDDSNSDNDDDTSTVISDSSSDDPQYTGGGKDINNDDEADEENVIDNNLINGDEDADSGDIEDDIDDNNDDDTLYLQKFNEEIKKNYILDFHPECYANNYDEISILTKVVRDKNNNIIDNLHKTIPFMTKYERTRVIGQRAKQINSGVKPFVKVPENIIDGTLVAELELSMKRIPFIIRRPTPGGGCEYWNLKDLEII